MNNALSPRPTWLSAGEAHREQVSCQTGHPFRAMSPANLPSHCTFEHDHDQDRSTLACTQPDGSPAWTEGRSISDGALRWSVIERSS